MRGKYLLFLAGLFLPQAALPAEKPAEKAPAAAADSIKCNLSQIPVKADGNGDEWETNRLPAITKDTRAGCYKDENFFYFHILTRDREFSMQLMNFGLTVWLDDTASEKKTTGIQFPVIQLQPPPPREGGKPPRGEELKRFLQKRMRELVLEFPDKREMKRLTITEANALGIDARVGVDEKKGTISYELKYPLLKSSGTAVTGLDLNERKSLGICVETPDMDPSRLKEKFEKAKKSTGTVKLEEAPDRDDRPLKESEETRPPKPTKKPPMGRISLWLKAIF